MTWYTILIIQFIMWWSGYHTAHKRYRDMAEFELNSGAKKTLLEIKDLQEKTMIGWSNLKDSALELKMAAIDFKETQKRCNKILVMLSDAIVKHEKTRVFSLPPEFKELLEEQYGPWEIH